MKKNVKKLNKKLKAILCLCLALLFSFSAFLFAGCDKDIGDIGGGSGGGGGGENQRTFFENYVSGIAAVYANSAGGGYSGLKSENTKLLLTNIETGLLSNYGSGANSDKYKYPTDDPFYDDPFYDSIRMLVTAPNGNINSIPAKVNKGLHWNWTFEDIVGRDTNILEYIKPNNENFDEWKQRILHGEDESKKLVASNYLFPSYYSDVLQMILYEIMLGYEPTKLVVTKENVTNFSFTDLMGATVSNASGTLLVVKYKDNEIYKSLFRFTSPDQKTYTLDTIVSYNNQTNGIKTYLYGEGGTKDKPTGGLAKEYLEKSRYVGLTKQNADKLIDYILTEIIGTNLVLFDYNEYKYKKNEPVNFRNYVSTIAYLVYSQTYDGSDEDWVYSFPSGNSTKITYTFDKEQRGNAKTKGLLNKSELGSFMAKPATYVKYFPGESFFGDPDATDQFAGKPYAEYQSIVIVPAISAETKKDGGIKLEAGFVFNFMTQNKNLRIIPKVRYCVYNEETGTQFFYEFAADEINFSGAQSFVNAAGQTCYEDDFDFGVDISKLDPSLVKTQVDSTGYKETTYTVGFFKNKELLDSVVNETRLTEQEGVQNFYKVVESKNGHGGTTVLNEKHINSSFFEIVFDIVKSETDPENTDYNFSLVLSNSLLYPGIY